MIRVATTRAGALIFIVAALVIAGLGLLAANASTDDVCDRFGYRQVDFDSCETTGGLQVAQIAGGAAGLTTVFFLWGLFSDWSQGRRGSRGRLRVDDDEDRRRQLGETVRQTASKLPPRTPRLSTSNVAPPGGTPPSDVRRVQGMVGATSALDRVSCSNGHINPSGKVFCGDCGIPLPTEWRCRSGHVNPSDKRFCGDCGQGRTESDTAVHGTFPRPDGGLAPVPDAGTHRLPGAEKDDANALSGQRRLSGRPVPVATASPHSGASADWKLWLLWIGGLAAIIGLVTALALNEDSEGSPTEDRTGTTAALGPNEVAGSYAVEDTDEYSHQSDGTACVAYNGDVLVEKSLPVIVTDAATHSLIARTTLRSGFVDGTHCVFPFEFTLRKRADAYLVEIHDPGGDPVKFTWDELLRDGANIELPEE